MSNEPAGRPASRTPDKYDLMNNAELLAALDEIDDPNVMRRITNAHRDRKLAESNKAAK